MPIKHQYGGWTKNRVMWLLEEYPQDMSPLRYSVFSHIVEAGVQYVKDLTATLSFTGSHSAAKIASLFLAASLSFSGSHVKMTARSLTGSLSFAGAQFRAVARSLAASLGFTTGLAKFKYRIVDFTASLSFSAAFSSFFAWLQLQMAAIPNVLVLFHWPFRLLTGARHRANYNITIQVKGPIEMAYKRGTNVLFEATFTDKEGQLFDPDVGSAKMYVKLVSTGAYLTGYDRATGGRALTKISTGVYQGDWQSELTSVVGQYEVEMEGYLGTKRFLDSLKISVRA